MSNVIGINVVNNRNLEYVIKFLEPFSSTDEINQLAIGGVLMSMPSVVLHDMDIRELHGYVGGSIVAYIGKLVTDLTAINEKPIEMQSLGAMVFKDFREDTNTGAPFATLTIPFLDTVIAINFINLNCKWYIVNIWENSSNKLEEFFKRFMERNKLDDATLFNLPKEDEFEVDDVPTIVKVINNDDKSYSSRQRTYAAIKYNKLFDAEPNGNEDMEFPIEVILGLGLLGSGLSLPVKRECMSTYHVGDAMDICLPYKFKDGSSNKLLCNYCFNRERRDIVEEHPEWENNY